MADGKQNGGGLGLTGNLLATAIVGVGVKYLGPLTGLKLDDNTWTIVAAISFVILSVAATFLFKRSRTLVVARLRRWNRAEAKGDRIAIAVATLVADDDGSLSSRVEISLEKELGKRVEVIRCDETIASGKWGSLEERREAGAKAARELAARTKADVVIWGEALRADRVVDLYFTTRETDGGGVHSYQLTPVLQLPDTFGVDLAPAIAAVAASAAAPSIDKAGTYLVPTLRPVLARLSHFIDSPPPSLRGEMKGTIYFAFALAAATVGDQSGDSQLLTAAIAAYREALKERTRERLPLAWAMTQNNLGNALRRLGERESGTARLEEAAIAFREALKEHTRERVPLDWAMTQNNLGAVLKRLGERESGTSRLEDAITTYREALLEFTRERVPLDWAMTQNNLGNALTSLGERENSTVRFEEAAAAFHEALKERNRERVPLALAMTQNNLGTALARLGERGSDTGRLEEAAAAFREALKERTRERVPLAWAMTQNNLGNVLTSLGERERGTARLEEAVAAFREALKERTRQRVPLDWAMTQNNLGNALKSLGERESGTARLEEAAAAYREALKEWREDNVPYYQGITTRNLARAEALLAERRGQKT